MLQENSTVAKWRSTKTYHNRKNLCWGTQEQIWTETSIQPLWIPPCPFRLRTARHDAIVVDILMRKKDHKIPISQSSIVSGRPSTTSPPTWVMARLVLRRIWRIAWLDGLNVQNIIQSRTDFISLILFIHSRSSGFNLVCDMTRDY